MKNVVIIPTMLTAFFLSAGARAGVLYDNLGATSAGTDSVAGFGPLADSFSIGENPVTLASITVLISGDPAGAGQTEIALMSDDNNAPGNVIISGVFDDSSTSANLATLTAVGNVLLSADTRYWIELSSINSSSVSWSYSEDLSGPGVLGEFFSNSNGVFSNVNAPYQMEVLSTPEPGTWALMLLGMGGLGVVLRRRGTRAAVIGTARIVR